MSTHPTPAPVGRTLLNYAEVAHKLGVSISIAKNLARDGEFPKVRIGKASIRFLEADIDAYVDRQRDAA